MIKGFFFLLLNDVISKDKTKNKTISKISKSFKFSWIAIPTTLCSLWSLIRKSEWYEEKQTKMKNCSEKGERKKNCKQKDRMKIKKKIVEEKKNNTLQKFITVNSTSHRVISVILKIALHPYSLTFNPTFVQFVLDFNF